VLDLNAVLSALTGSSFLALILALLQRRWAKQDKLDAIQKSLDSHIHSDDERYAKQCRKRILRFNDELIRGDRHTKEHFDDVLGDITDYKQYCDDHPEFENEKAVLAIANVRRVYQECEIKHSFLDEKGVKHGAAV